MIIILMILFGNGTAIGLEVKYASGFNTSSPRVYGIWGYYQDAGDWDGYVWHSKVPISLLMLYDLAPDRFYDGDVDNKYKLNASDANWIDEGSNGIPDLLDEASWLIKYHKRARNVLKDNYGGTGGCPGYVGRDGGAKQQHHGMAGYQRLVSIQRECRADLLLCWFSIVVCDMFE